MIVYIGADHRGYELKESIKTWLKEQNVEFFDVGARTHDASDDYVDFAYAAALRVAEALTIGREVRGIVICGSGIGVAIAANKLLGIRCGFGMSPGQVKAGRNDDDINMLALASDFTSEKEAKEMAHAFLETPFATEERFKRRIEKLRNLEQHD